MGKFPFVTILAIAISASSASADCGKTYKSFWEGLDDKGIGTLSAERLAAISRMALDAYDACQAGDERQAKALFARIALWDGRRDQSTGPYNPNLPE